jgi:hypothetical protein
MLGNRNFGFGGGGTGGGGGGTIGGGGTLNYVAMFSPDGVNIADAPIKIGDAVTRAYPANTGQDSVAIGYGTTLSGSDNYSVGYNISHNGTVSFIVGHDVSIDNTAPTYGAGNIFSFGQAFTITGGIFVDAVVNLGFANSITATSETRGVYLFGDSHICTDFVTYSTLIGDSCGFTRVDHSTAIGIFTNLTDVTYVYTFGEGNTIDTSSAITNFGTYNFISGSTNLGVFGNGNTITDSDKLYIGNNNNNLVVDGLTGAVGIGTVSPDASSILDLTSTSRGFLAPRMTTLERNAIAAPATALFIYNTGSNLFEYWDGTAWQQIDSNATSEWLLDGNTNGALKYIGTNDLFDFPVYTNGVEVAIFKTDGSVGIGTSTPAQTLHVVAPVGGYGIRTSTGANYVDIVPNGSNFIEFLTNRNGYEFISDTANLRLNRSGAVGASLIYGNNLDSIQIGDNTGIPILTALYSNNSVGIGALPTARLEVWGIDSTIANYVFKAKNSIGTDLFNIRDDGAVSVGGGNGFPTSTFSVRGHRIGTPAEPFIIDMYNNTESRGFFTAKEDGVGAGTTASVEIMSHVGIACITAYDYLNTTPRIGFGSHYVGDAALLNSRNDIQSVGADALFSWTNTLSGILIDSDKGLAYANPYIQMTTSNGVNIGSVKISSYGDSYFNGGNVAIAPFSFTAPTAMLHVRGIDATVANYAQKIQDNVGSELFCVRNDGFVGIGTNTWLNPFPLGNLGIKMPYLFIDMQDTAGTSNLTIQQGNFSTSTAIATYNYSHAIDSSKVAAIELDDATGNIWFGGYGYPAQKYVFSLNYQNTNVGTPQKFAIGSGLHTVDTGGNVFFYGASNSASNSQYAYASIQGLKENAIDTDIKGYLPFSTSDGSGSLIEAGRFDSAQNLVIGTTVAAARFHNFGMFANINQRLEPVAGVTEDISGATTTTSGAVTVTLQTIAIPTDTIYLIEVRVTCKKTAGAGAGTIGDGNGYIRTACYANIGGVVTISGVVQSSFTGEGIAPLNATLTISGTNVLVRVSGSVNNDVTWNTITRIEKVG